MGRSDYFSALSALKPTLAYRDFFFNKLTRWLSNAIVVWRLHLLQMLVLGFSLAWHLLLCLVGEERHQVRVQMLLNSVELE